MAPDKQGCHRFLRNCSYSWLVITTSRYLPGLNAATSVSDEKYRSVTSELGESNRTTIFSLAETTVGKQAAIMSNKIKIFLFFMGSPYFLQNQKQASYSNKSRQLTKKRIDTFHEKHCKLFSKQLRRNNFFIIDIYDNAGFN